MSLVLVNPPIARYDVAELAPPLALLAVARTARSLGLEATILDLNLPQHRSHADSDAFYDYAAALLNEMRPSEVGITSMGVNSHVAIQLANGLKERTGVPVTVGGVHIGTIEPFISRHFPRIDRVATLELRRSSEGERNWWGRRNGSLGLGSGEHGTRDLYSAVDPNQYFRDNPRRVANLEAGRGCKYRCSFCYSPSTYDRWETESPSDVVESFEVLADLGFRHIFLVDDNLTNSPEWLCSLAKRLAAQKLNLTWNGYATLPDLDDGTLEVLGQAGCVDLYVGIDTVDSAQQKQWKKEFYNGVQQLRSLLNTAAQVGVTLTCAFIIDPVDEAIDSTLATLDCALTLKLHGARVRLSALAYYPGSRLNLGAHSALGSFVYSEARAAVMMDLPSVVVRNPLAPSDLRSFPWHNRPRRCADWDVKMLAIAVAQTILGDADQTPEVLSNIGTGASLWTLSLLVASAILPLEGIHKTQLKQTIRSTYRQVLSTQPSMSRIASCQ